MKIICLFGQRVESYSGEYAPEMLAEIAVFKAEREKMKCCGNCKNLEEDYDGKRMKKFVIQIVMIIYQAGNSRRIE